MNTRMRFAFLPLAVSLLTAGCAHDLSLERTRLEGTGQYGALEQRALKEIGQSQKVTAIQQYDLCVAYSRLKRYTQLFKCVSDLEKKFSEGDRRIVLSQCSGSSDGAPTPHLLRVGAYLELGKYDLAVMEAEKALVQAPQVTWTLSCLGIDRLWYEIDALTYLGLAHAFNQDRARATIYLARLRQLDVGTMGSALSQGLKANGLAKIYLALGQHEQALAALKADREGIKNAIREFGSGVFGGGQDLFAYQNLPKDFMINRCLFETGKIAEAKTGYDKLLAIPQTKDNGDIYWLLLYDRGRIAEREGNRRQAIEFYRKAVEVVEAQRASINTEASKIGFVGDKQVVYQRLIATLFVEGQYAVAFEYIERAKARALVDMLASKQDFAVHTANASAVRTLLARANTAEAEGRVQDFSADTGRQRSLAIQTRQQLHQQAPELSSLVTVTPVTVQEIQNRLPSDEVLVEYYAEGKEVYAFVLSKTGLQGIKLNGEGLTAEIQHFRQAVQDSRSSHYRDFAGRLYNRLVRPLEGAMKQRNLLIVAHGPLHYLPFNALHDGNSYLIERYSLRLLPSASVLKYLKGVRPQTAGTLLAFGNPDLGDPTLDLQHAQAEALSVSKILPNSKALVRKEASESAFKRYGEGFKYLHIASHGTFNADSPLTSALLLAKDGTNDGTLTVGELYSMRLNADLVTLSACETGLGKIANGDDVVGLTRGFLYAGSRSIVASLWKVDDEATAYLMTRFYGALKGTSKREALRLAQLETRKKYAHPYYWAAFQLTGEAS